jgi:hypothetical protein
MPNTKMGAANRASNAKITARRKARFVIARPQMLS